MTITVLLSCHPRHLATWRPALAHQFAAAGIAAAIVTNPPDPTAIDYIIHDPDSPLHDFTPFTRLRAVLSMWAGVETIAGNPTLTVPLTRMVDPGIVEGMTEWITGQVLRHHLGFDQHIGNTTGNWLDTTCPPLARHRTVGILGTGVLGRAAAAILQALHFTVIGWSRQRRDGTDFVIHCGQSGLEHVLGTADLLVLLLPHTPATDTLLNADTLALMKPGSIIINAGRGALIDDTALLAALDEGTVAHATLDVFRTEPLPADHPFWAHPRISIWPHIAAATRVETASGVIVANIARHLAGQSLHDCVDPDRGY